MTGRGAHWDSSTAQSAPVSCSPPPTGRQLNNELCCLETPKMPQTVVVVSGRRKSGICDGYEGSVWEGWVMQGCYDWERSSVLILPDNVTCEAVAPQPVHAGLRPPASSLDGATHHARRST